jgi:hypothetical protein
MPDALQCSFCSKPDREIAQLIEGPGTYICNECVALCVAILKTPPSGRSGPAIPSWGELDDQQLLARLPRIAAAVAQVEGSLRSWVGEARRRGLSWTRIGESLGMARQSAWERFAHE